MLSFEVIQGLLLPFLGTVLGAAGVYVLKDELNPLVQKGLYLEPADSRHGGILAAGESGLSACGAGVLGRDALPFGP